MFARDWQGLAVVRRRGRVPARVRQDATRDRERPGRIDTAAGRAAVATIGAGLAVLLSIAPWLTLADLATTSTPFPRENSTRRAPELPARSGGDAEPFALRPMLARELQGLAGRGRGIKRPAIAPRRAWRPIGERRGRRVNRHVAVVLRASCRPVVEATATVPTAAGGSLAATIGAGPARTRNHAARASRLCGDVT
jgi:hypothetical protein